MNESTSGNNDTSSMVEPKNLGAALQEIQRPSVVQETIGMDQHKMETELDFQQVPEFLKAFCVQIKVVLSRSQG
jgi:hypothetical protein